MAVASRMRTHARARPVVGPRIEDGEDYGFRPLNLHDPPSERLRRASTAKQRGYPEYRLALVRDRVEEEIAANLFVRGAWRELRRKHG